VGDVFTTSRRHAAQCKCADGILPETILRFTALFTRERKIIDWDFLWPSSIQQSPAKCVIRIRSDTVAAKVNNKLVVQPASTNHGGYKWLDT
jgi:hypothetical protein